MKEAIKLSKEGFDLYKNQDYEQAVIKYEKAINLLDESLPASQDIYGDFALVLKDMGNLNAAVEMSRKSLEVAVETNKPSSVNVTFARFCLGEKLGLQGQYDDALSSINPSLNIDCESKFLLYFLASSIFLKLGNKTDYEAYAEKAYFIWPKKSEKSFEQLKTQINGHSANFS
jgi:tetratricopeptide (TPR) repeat protein